MTTEFRDGDTVEKVTEYGDPIGSYGTVETESGAQRVWWHNGYWEELDKVRDLIRHWE